MIGAGVCPAGLSPGGYGAPDEAPSPVGKVFKNTIDLSTPAVQLTGRLVDKLSKQYVFGTDGRIVGQQTVQQLVQIRYLTLKNSSAVKNLGHELNTIDVIGPDHQRRVTQLLTEPVQDLIDQNLMSIRAISVQRVGVSGTIARVDWIDLTTRQEHVDFV